jgi:adenylylsulfate kinase
MNKVASVSVWITGLPGCGKSTVAEALRSRLTNSIVVRMDELRQIATPEPTYSSEERDILYRCLIYTAKLLSTSGHDVIVDATGNMRKWRKLARDTLPGFIEVYLECPLSLCKEREMSRKAYFGAPSGIYEKAGNGWPVPGVNVAYELPEKPELRYDSGRLDVDTIAEGIAAFANSIR